MSNRAQRFQYKLWDLVNSCKSKAVRWSETRDSLIFKFDLFKKEYLDANDSFCKSHKIASFVRQLNLYGFKKIVDVNRNKTTQKAHSEHEFQNSFFIYGRSDLLKNVVRNSTTRPNISRKEKTNVRSSRDSINGKENEDKPCKRVYYYQKCQVKAKSRRGRPSKNLKGMKYESNDHSYERQKKSYNKNPIQNDKRKKSQPLKMLLVSKQQQNSNSSSWKIESPISEVKRWNETDSISFATYKTLDEEKNATLLGSIKMQTNGFKQQAAKDFQTDQPTEMKNMNHNSPRQIEGQGSEKNNAFLMNDKHTRELSCFPNFETDMKTFKALSSMKYDAQQYQLDENLTSICDTLPSTSYFLYSMPNYFTSLEQLPEAKFKPTYTYETDCEVTDEFITLKRAYLQQHSNRPKDSLTFCICPQRVNEEFYYT